MAEKLIDADGLLSTAEVCELLRISRTTLWKLERTTDFPKHLSYGMRMKRWRLGH